MTNLKFKGSKTEKNLLAAFAGESQARNRYDYFASQARKDGYVQISNIFLVRVGMSPLPCFTPICVPGLYR